MPDPASPSAPDHVGEVIAADSVRFEAECPRLYEAPDFGAFVRVETDGRRLYAVVCQVATAPIDAHRRLQAFGLPPEQIAERMPHLDLVLRTTFAARVVGFREGTRTLPYLPPQPARAHAFVYPAEAAEVRALTAADSPTLFRTLAAATEAPVEEVLAAALREAEAAWKDEPHLPERRVAWGKCLARLFRNEPDRFEAVRERWLPAGAPGTSWEAELPATSDPSDPFS